MGKLMLVKDNAALWTALELDLDWKWMIVNVSIVLPLQLKLHSPSCLAMNASRSVCFEFLVFWNCWCLMLTVTSLLWRYTETV